MPAIVGPIKITSISDGIVNFGDSFYLSPKSSAQTYAGSGGFNTGDIQLINNGASVTNTLDPDLIDQPTVGNG